MVLLPGSLTPIPLLLLSVKKLLLSPVERLSV